MKKIRDWLWQDRRETDSTNDEAAKLCAAARGEKFIVSAASQTGGRGRRGRAWDSLTGNLFVSFAFPAALKDASRLIFIVSLGLLETVRRLKPGIDVCLKWPNDVLVNGGKVSGILMEKAAGDYMVVGIGVNVAAAPRREDILYPVASLREAGLVIDRLDFLKEYVGVFDDLLAEWKEKGFAPLRERWLANAKNLGKEINVHMEHEDKKGIFNGVDENGALLLETPSGIEKIYAGDIFYLKEKEVK